ncbi:hypothetical protein, partial [Halomonas sp. BC2]|uniref:hypothetical protein n=1 Tax=Halomonas sp. BC2 TaxID=1670449 RepID=UPI001BB07A31
MLLPFPPDILGSNLKTSTSTPVIGNTWLFFNFNSQSLGIEELPLYSNVQRSGCSQPWGYLSMVSVVGYAASSVPFQEHLHAPTPRLPVLWPHPALFTRV